MGAATLILAVLASDKYPFQTNGHWTLVRHVQTSISPEPWCLNGICGFLAELLNVLGGWHAFSMDLHGSSVHHQNSMNRLETWSSWP